MRRTRAVESAYERALDFPCPHCGAGPGVHCTRTADDGTVYTRKIPCVRRAHRIRPLDVDIVDDPYEDIDFTEPRRGQKELW